MNDNIVKKGRGRPKGSAAPNVVEISIQDFLSKIQNKNINIVKVSRTWLNALDSGEIMNDDVPSVEDKIEFKKY